MIIFLNIICNFAHKIEWYINQPSIHKWQAKGSSDAVMTNLGHAKGLEKRDEFAKPIHFKFWHAMKKSE